MRSIMMRVRDAGGSEPLRSATHPAMPHMCLLFQKARVQIAETVHGAFQRKGFESVPGGLLPQLFTQTAVVDCPRQCARQVIHVAGPPEKAGAAVENHFRDAAYLR